MRSQVELEFWQDVFRTALGNPDVTASLLKLAKESNTLLVILLADFADQSVKELRNRTSERDGTAYFEYNLLSGTPK